tara:strand:+ start:3847 stop:4116 length:270 start_codon:yes stop_codon:yes gene_type:complete
MEKHVFKVSDDGEFTGDGFRYDCKCVSKQKASELVDLGWSYSLEVPEQGSDYETELRAQIKALGKTPGGRSSIATLEKQLKELQDDNEG